MEKTAIELFAGVGGFRVGLNHVSSFDEEGKAIENGNFHFLWANQWGNHPRRFSMPTIAITSVSLLPPARIAMSISPR